MHRGEEDYVSGRIRVPKTDYNQALVCMLGGCVALDVFFEPYRRISTRPYSSDDNKIARVGY